MGFKGISDLGGGQKPEDSYFEKLEKLCRKRKSVMIWKSSKYMNGKI